MQNHDFAPNQETVPCNWKGCEQEGMHKAPASNRALNKYQIFCLDHIRAFNKNWNFFNGMSPEEIEKFQIDSITGHRPTHPMGVKRGFANFDTDDIREKIFEEFGFGWQDNNKRKAPSRSNDEIQAVKKLQLSYPLTAEIIKKKYKALVKQYHPDINGNKYEEKLKEITHAYAILKKIYKV
jgi:hypothetical protein